MTDKEAAAKMKSLDLGDEEIAHQAEDDLLCDLLLELGYTETVKEYLLLPKWYA